MRLQSTKQTAEPVLPDELNDQRQQRVHYPRAPREKPAVRSAPLSLTRVTCLLRLKQRSKAWAKDGGPVPAQRQGVHLPNPPERSVLPGHHQTRVEGWLP